MKPVLCVFLCKEETKHKNNIYLLLKLVLEMKQLFCIFKLFLGKIIC